MTSRDRSLNIHGMISHSSQHQSLVQGSYNENGVVELAVLGNRLGLSQETEISRPGESVANCLV